MSSQRPLAWWQRKVMMPIAPSMVQYMPTSLRRCPIALQPASTALELGGGIYGAIRFGRHRRGVKPPKRKPGQVTE